MTQLSERWQRYFAEIAITVSTGSLDPSTQHGAIIYRPDRSIASTGFNGLPRGLPDDPEKLKDRDWKYPRIVHAEANALDHKRECVHGYGMVITGSPCPDCALKIISNGIKTVYHFPMHREFEARWAEKCKLSFELFAEAGVYVKEMAFPFIEPMEEVNKRSSCKHKFKGVYYYDGHYPDAYICEHCGIDKDNVASKAT